MSGLWRSDVERDLWEDKHCATCYQPDQAALRATGTGGGCPLLAQAEANILPDQWHPRRYPKLGDTYRCEDYAAQPATLRQAKPKVDENQSAMFEVQPVERLLVPVEGWDDYRAQARRGDEHQ